MKIKLLFFLAAIFLLSGCNFQYHLTGRSDLKVIKIKSKKNYLITPSAGKEKSFARECNLINTQKLLTLNSNENTFQITGNKNVAIKIQKSKKDFSSNRYALLSSFHANNNNINKLDATGLRIVSDFEINNTGLAQVYAENLLTKYGYIFDPNPYLPKDETERREETLTVDKNALIVLTPKPCKDYLSVSWQPFDMNIRRIEVADVTGKIWITKTIANNGFQTIDVAEIPAGTYRISFFTESKNPITKLFIHE